jgi:regulator of replication initiation timing
LFCFVVLEESDKEKKNLKIELTNLKDELHECKEQIKTLTLEEKKLQKVIQDAVEDKEKQKKVVEQVSVNQVSVLHTSLAKLMFLLLKQFSVTFIFQDISKQVLKLFDLRFLQQ